MPRGGRRPNTGGRRPGAGRKKGAATKKTRKVADRLIADGITPLEVMIDAMRRLHRVKKYAPAAAIAAQAAPYVHPRLSSVQHQGRVGVTLEVVEEIIDAHDPQDGATAPRSGGLPPQ